MLQFLEIKICNSRVLGSIALSQAELPELPHYIFALDCFLTDLVRWLVFPLTLSYLSEFLRQSHGQSQASLFTKFGRPEVIMYVPIVYLLNVVAWLIDHVTRLSFVDEWWGGGGGGGGGSSPWTFDAYNYTYIYLLCLL